MLNDVAEGLAGTCTKVHVNVCEAVPEAAPAVVNVAIFPATAFVTVKLDTLLVHAVEEGVQPDGYDKTNLPPTGTFVAGVNFQT